MYKRFLVLCLISSSLLSARCPDCKHPPHGPPGPPGTAVVCPEKSFLSVFTNSSQTVDPQDPVIFEQTAIGASGVSGTAMSYNSGTGTVTFNETGFYRAIYALGADTPPEAGAVLQLTPGGIYSPGPPPFPAGSGIVPGSAGNSAGSFSLAPIGVIFEVTIVGQTLQLVSANSAGNSFSLSSLTPGTVLPDAAQGYLVIVQL